jgi:hypothetical protein
MATIRKENARLQIDQANLMQEKQVLIFCLFCETGIDVLSVLLSYVRGEKNSNVG